MSDFTSAFLNEDWGSRVVAPQIFLGAFGKHPGWNDHMDDIGLATHSLATLRRVLYGSGIAAQIESAAWENQSPGKVLPEFDHAFCWRRPAELIVGKIWTSRDGKGRRLYPMLLAAHCVGLSFDAVVKRVLPALETTATECRNATVAGDVITAIDRAQTELRSHLNGGAEQPKNDSTLGIPAWTHYFDRHRTDLARIFHHLLTHFQAFVPDGQAAWSLDSSPNRSRHLRFPVVSGGRAGEVFNTWLGFLSTQIDTAAPMLAILPYNESWVDLVIGDPVPTDFFALRAGSSAVPLVTEIPYQLDGMAARLGSVFTALESKQFPSASILNGESYEANKVSAQRWLARQRPSGRSFINRLFRAG